MSPGEGLFSSSSTCASGVLVLRSREGHSVTPGHEARPQHLPVVSHELAPHLPSPVSVLVGRG